MLGWHPLAPAPGRRDGFGNVALYESARSRQAAQEGKSCVDLERHEGPSHCVALCQGPHTIMVANLPTRPMKRVTVGPRGIIELDAMPVIVLGEPCDGMGFAATHHTQMEVSL